MAENKPAVWVFCEQANDEPLKIGLELLAKGRTLADQLDTELVAVILGKDLRAAAPCLIKGGADRVLAVQHPDLAEYAAEPYADVLVQLAKERQPVVWLFGATFVGRDLAPVVAVGLETGLSADCTELTIGADGLLHQIVPAFRGMATIICPAARPQMATVRPGVFQALPPDETRQGEVEWLTAEPVKARLQTIGRQRYADQGAPLEEAERVVAGGAGIDGQEGWDLLNQLAQALGAAVGATRPPLDDGFVAEGQMIGQSGKTVRPKLYIGIGISGEMQHLVGIQDAELVIAINKDPKAAIFPAADYGIVGDYKQIVPLLLEQLQMERQV
ncbi:MAG TPA: electron transfer flavoprotein subunit alpha/FixB family protein [Firmicutes bacterium]|jgi:electron transfer flavoprotein alpha subunit|nr:electron transfer flavoprotein subunit alpha/FixB family protein [Bacillota bacterium]